MTTPNDTNDGGDNSNDSNSGEGRKLSPTEAAIIDLMKKQSIGTNAVLAAVNGHDDSDGEKKHAFWDTQVS